ncbi:threonylcarbamoyladenosine tRNA methylthiotransferase MtaB [Thermodesulfobium acidiphilum]|uniref:Threonylcarbamoyladenosine tRNA methylthiotransferase MtaB n=1 Tax=Thermodesulfobium acidiphilum TaxID=1794699 RepID=A0A2R4W1H4_THEAF|nr:radical SAM protein [Thermodesulfobium acidiphilum]AWB10629.1 threonylcarbamoyladenosine tRNA methylthiotransferase MtaB [Thermodesulfobium acidiphilum]
MILNKKVFSLALGCKVSQADLAKFKEIFFPGCIEELSASLSDVIILSSCAVTEKAQKESIRMLKKFSKLNKQTYFLGCAVTAYGDLKKLFPQVIFFNNKELEELLTSRVVNSNYRGRKRYILKVGDGCCRECTYCIIRFLRGPLKSRPFEDIKKEILLLHNVDEIVLSAIELALWGYDLGLDIVWLLKEIVTLLDGNDIKIRLGSIYPALLLNKEFINFMISSNKIQPHLHLSLQSASPKVLRSMKRFANVDKILDKIFQIKEKRNDFLVSADIIVGYPTESDKDFQMTIDFLDRLPLVRVHSFPFSSRKGTVASQFKPLDKKIIIERQKMITERFSQSRILKKFIDKEIPSPLWERGDEKYVYGHSSNYIPVKANKNKLNITLLKGKSLDKNYLVVG